MVYPLWSAKDILGHITFWHESFSRNLKDLVKNVKPTPLKGKLSEVNNASVMTTKDITIPTLIKRLKTAHRTIKLNITNPNVNLIPYKKGSRDYDRLEHLIVVNNHIQKHLRDLKKSAKRK